MTTYFISPSGSDSNNGLSPDATTGNTNKPWLTLGKALNTGSPLNAGDTVYIGPGYYYSAACTPLATISSAGSPTQFIGEPRNLQGFKDSSGVLLAAGLPWVTTRSTGDTLDGPISSSSNLFAANTNKPSGMQFKYLVLEANIQNPQGIWAFDASAGTDILFQDCVILSHCFQYVTGAPTAGRNFTIRRCEVVMGWGFLLSTATAAATANANMGVLMEESLFLGGVPCPTNAYGAAGGNIAGGVSIQDCTIVGGSAGGGVFATPASRVSTVNPMHVGGCLILSNDLPFSAGTTGQIIDDGYNRMVSRRTTCYTNTTQAGTSFIDIGLNLVLPHLVTWGLGMPRNDFLGWTDAAASTQAFSASGRTTPDFRGRTARPWGAGSSIGCWQAQAVSEDTGSTVTGGGANSLKITGAGEVSIFIPVDASATTISITTVSGSYGGTTWPSMVVVANGAIGLATDQTVSATSASVQAITSPTFTPTAKGVVEVRLISQSTSTTSTTNFDILTSP